jgi:hypothetical protein
MRFLPVINKEEAKQLKTLSVVAVDLGFSGRLRTTGIAWSLPSESDAKVYRFGESVIAVAERFRSIGEVALVLEAPLSAAFDISGNPRPRGRFEREPQSRWWSVGPGAATALSALFFLRELKFQLKSTDVTIHLVEGFVTGIDSGDHDQVATALRDGFQERQNCQWHSVTEDGRVISTLEWMDCELPQKPPVILQPVAGQRLSGID